MPQLTISTNVKVDGKKFTIAYTTRKRSNQRFADTAAGVVALFVEELNKQKIEGSQEPIEVPTIPLLGG